MHSKSNHRAENLLLSMISLEQWESEGGAPEGAWPRRDMPAEHGQASGECVHDKPVARERGDSGERES